MQSTPIRAAALALAALIATGCNEPVADPVIPNDLRPNFAAKPGGPGAAAHRQLYQVRLGDANGSRSHGVMLIEVVGGHLAVTVNASGLAPREHIPQHIHRNPTCANGGAVLVNLDATLTVLGEGAAVGAAYPVANNGGVVKYYASRPLADMIAPVNARFGSGGEALLDHEIKTVEELLEFLDLEARNAHMHGFAAPYTPMNCGEVERIN